MIKYAVENGIVVSETEKIPAYGECDVVVGDGMTGVGAGIAAAKEGAKTIIIENTLALGGIVTMGIVNITLDFVSGKEAELFDELKKINGIRKRNSNPEKHKLVCDRMVKKYGRDVLLVTPLIDTIVSENDEGRYNLYKTR